MPGSGPGNTTNRKLSAAQNAAKQIRSRTQDELPNSDIQA